MPLFSTPLARARQWFVASLDRIRDGIEKRLSPLAPNSTHQSCTWGPPEEKTHGVGEGRLCRVVQKQLDIGYLELLNAQAFGAEQRGRLVRLIGACEAVRALPGQIRFDCTYVSESAPVAQTLDTDVLSGVLGTGKGVCIRRYRIGGIAGTKQSAFRDALIKVAIKDAIVSSCLRHARILPFEGVFRTGHDNFDRIDLAHAPYDNIMGYLAGQPNADRKSLLRDVAEALKFLHGNDIVHGGVNDRVVFVHADVGKAFLSDFSLAYFIGSEFVSTPYTQRRSSSLQTLPWQAPEMLEELLRDECMAPSKASDVYAFGCLACKVYTDKEPFQELMGAAGPRAIAQVISAVCVDDKRPLKPDVGGSAFVRWGLTEEIWEMIESCWRRDPHMRTEASELTEILVRV